MYLNPVNPGWANATTVPGSSTAATNAPDYTTEQALEAAFRWLPRSDVDEQGNITEGYRYVAGPKGDIAEKAYCETQLQMAHLERDPGMRGVPIYMDWSTGTYKAGWLMPNCVIPITQMPSALLQPKKPGRGR